MGKSRFLPALEFRDYSLGQLLAQFDSPLVKRVDVPNRTLCKYAVFVKDDQFTESFWRESVSQNRVRRAIALEHPVRHEPVRRAFRLDLFRRLTEGERFGLREHISQEDVVMSAKRVERLVERYEVTWNESRSLMD